MMPALLVLVYQAQLVTLVHDTHDTVVVQINISVAELQMKIYKEIRNLRKKLAIKHDREMAS